MKMKNTLALALDAVDKLAPTDQSDPHIPKRRDARARARETNAPDTMNQADVDKQINQVRAADDDDENATRRDVRLFANPPAAFVEFRKTKRREEKPERRLT